MERLEATVRRNASVWRQFVIYLKTKLEEWNNSLAHVIKLTFTDDVFLLYSYTSLLSEKPLLRNYAIFSNCIREACPGMTRSMLTATSSFRYIPRLPPPPPGARRTTTKLSALSSTRSGGVDGFSFPLSTADEIECLEAAVRQSQRIWEQYVQFLRNQKTTAMDIAGVMKLLFQDEALDGYNFNGIQGRQRQKRPLRMYAIFVDCMLEAWQEQDIDGPQLQKGITVAITASKSRQRVKRCRENKRYLFKRIQLFKQSAQEGVDNFIFPIPDCDTIERLEVSVRMFPNIRKQYVEHLRRVKDQTKEVVKAFPVLFSDTALEMYNYMGTGRKERRAMRDYHIFHDCMLEAWSEDGVNELVLAESINIVIKRADGRKRAKLFNFRRRIFQNVGTIFSSLGPDPQL
ncbi:hypothetical protein pipiens_005953 [Culex pipiens pipiens]|uniref:DUF4806 domain-containing protein n=2 Tax=Culex pipiens TaxID=7175 RepID=A0ABD1DSG4_CULPP